MENVEKHLTEFNIPSWFEKKNKTKNLCKLEIGKALPKPVSSY